MSAWDDLNRAQKKHVADLVDCYQENGELFRRFLVHVQTLIVDNDALRPFIHSTKGRLKDPSHLRDKLARQCLKKAASKAKARSVLDINRSNLFVRINDLVGFRVLHLHTRQIEKMHPIIVSAFKEAKIRQVEKPFARTWDDESREFYSGVGLKTEVSPSMYTSVHYIVQSNSQTKITAEIQVRTLAEELWGEVDHLINYPEKSPVSTCREQIRVLARAASSCTRLVDSIFDAHNAEARRR